MSEAAAAMYELNADEIVRQQCMAREEYNRHERMVQRKLAEQEQALQAKDQALQQKDQVIAAVNEQLEQERQERRNANEQLEQERKQFQAEIERLQELIAQKK